jgi:hypothetical protein
MAQSWAHLLVHTNIYDQMEKENRTPLVEPISKKKTLYHNAH